MATWLAVRFLSDIQSVLNPVSQLFYVLLSFSNATKINYNITDCFFASKKKRALK